MDRAERIDKMDHKPPPQHWTTEYLRIEKGFYTGERPEHPLAVENIKNVKSETIRCIYKQMLESMKRKQKYGQLTKGFTK